LHGAHTLGVVRLVIRVERIRRQGWRHRRSGRRHRHLRHGRHRHRRRRWLRRRRWRRRYGRRHLCHGRRRRGNGRRHLCHWRWRRRCGHRRCGRRHLRRGRRRCGHRRCGRCIRSHRPRGADTVLVDVDELHTLLADATNGAGAGRVDARVRTEPSVVRLDADLIAPVVPQQLRGILALEVRVGRLARPRGQLLPVGRVVVRRLSLLVGHDLSLGGNGRIDRRHCNGRRRNRRISNGHRRFRLCRGGLFLWRCLCCRRLRAINQILFRGDGVAKAQLFRIGDLDADADADLAVTLPALSALALAHVLTTAVCAAAVGAAVAPLSKVATVRAPAVAERCEKVKRVPVVAGSLNREARHEQHPVNEKRRTERHWVRSCLMETGANKDARAL
jgi:hypothetical protein